MPGHTRSDGAGLRSGGMSEAAEEWHRSRTGRGKQEVPTIKSSVFL